MGQITRATILRDLAAPRVRKIATPEWGENGFVYVRELRASEATAVEHLADASQNGKADPARALAGWCVLGMCDKTGKRLFNDTDLDQLFDAPLAVLQRCALAVMEMNGLTEEGESERKKSAGQSPKTVRVRSRKGTRPRRR